MIKKDFKELKSTFKSSIKTWEYFVNWKKVFNNVQGFEITLNKLNYLLGKEDLEAEFKLLYADSPEVIKAFPVLLAVRENTLEIYNIDTKATKKLDFSSPEAHSPEEYFEFLSKTGLKRLFAEDGIKNLVDYVVGVEVGLDSNGRKNRGGTLMETIVEEHIKEFIEKNGYKYLSQANAAKIKKEWGFEVEVDKSSRSFDFAVFNPGSKTIKLFETNFYNGGGSKLKAVCGEFKGLHDFLKSQKIDFIWVTDGKGWETTLRPLEEVYNNNTFIFNLHMLENGILQDLKW